MQAHIAAVAGLTLATWAVSARAEPVSTTVWDEPEVAWADGRFLFKGAETYAWDPRGGAAVVLRGDQVPSADPLVASRTSPDGSSKADIAIIFPGEEGAWANAIWTPRSPARVELRVERRGRSTVVYVWSGAISSARVFWSPDGAYTAWVIRGSSWSGMDGGHSVSFVVAGGGAPRAQILGAPDLLPKVTRRIAEAIEPSGVAVVFIGKATKGRDTTVVYAAEGFEEVAAEVAKAIPGGAEVEKLTWAAGAELVIAAGKSAAGGGK